MSCRMNVDCYVEEGLLKAYDRGNPPLAQRPVQRFKGWWGDEGPGTLAP